MHWKMIGLCKQRNGFYILEFSTDFSSALPTSVLVLANSKPLYSFNTTKHTNSTFYVWHCRLGHPSFPRMSFLSNIMPQMSLSHNTSQLCSVCPLAKQKMIPFFNNNHLSLVPFDLLHVDIWGPYTTPIVEGYKSII